MSGEVYILMERFRLYFKYCMSPDTIVPNARQPYY